LRQALGQEQELEVKVEVEVEKGVVGEEVELERKLGQLGNTPTGSKGIST